MSGSHQSERNFLDSSDLLAGTEREYKADMRRTGTVTLAFSRLNTQEPQGLEQDGPQRDMRANLGQRSALNDSGMTDAPLRLLLAMANTSVGPEHGGNENREVDVPP